MIIDVGVMRSIPDKVGVHGIAWHDMAWHSRLTPVLITVLGLRQASYEGTWLQPTMTSDEVANGEMSISVSVCLYACVSVT